jgi:catechol 2,3-dioxygenase-like lactoylglutathione lyase family enzyme
MQVEQVDFVSVPTRDVERAVSWYRDTLGLAVSEVTPGEVEAPNVTLSFWNPERDGEPFQANQAGSGCGSRTSRPRSTRPARPARR